MLDLPDIGIHDNFFELGGNSIAAVRLMWEVLNAFGVELPLREVFDHPTAAALTARVEEAMLAAHAARGAGAADPKGTDR